jgi:hypothetical protein
VVVDVAIEPEPSEAERAAILAALAQERAEAVLAAPGSEFEDDGE